MLKIAFGRWGKMGRRGVRLTGLREEMWVRGVGEKEKSLAGMDSVISLSLLFLSSLHFAARADLGLFLLSIRGSLVSSINSSLLTLRSSSRLKIRVDSNRQSFSLCLLSRVPQSSSAPITEHSFPPLP